MMKIYLRISIVLVIISLLLGTVIAISYYETQQAFHEEYREVFNTFNVLETMEELRRFLALEGLMDPTLFHDREFVNIMTYIDEVLKTGKRDMPLQRTFVALIKEAFHCMKAAHIPPQDIDSVIIASHMRDIILNKTLVNTLI